MSQLSPELVHVLMADRLAEAESVRRAREHRAAPPRWRRVRRSRA